MVGLLNGFIRLQMDMLRTPQDFLAGVLGRSRLEKIAPGTATLRPVITLPGFSAPASSHARLVSFLNQCGYAAQTFEAGFPVDETIPDFVPSWMPRSVCLYRSWQSAMAAGCRWWGRALAGCSRASSQGFIPIILTV